MTAVALGRDVESGEALLWLETTEGGGAAYRLGNDAFKLLVDSLAQHRSERTTVAHPDRSAAE